jgi:hypothetical protein
MQPVAVRELMFHMSRARVATVAVRHLLMEETEQQALSHRRIQNQIQVLAAVDQDGLNRMI